MVPEAFCGYQVTSPVCSALLLRTSFGPTGTACQARGRGQAIFDRQAIQLGIKLLDAEGGRDLAGIATDGRELGLGWNRVDDHDQLGRMRALRADLAGTVERADIEPVFAVGARLEEEVSLLRRGLPPIVPMHAPVRRYVQLDLNRLLGGLIGALDVERDGEQRLPPVDRRRRCRSGQRRRRIDRTKGQDLKD